MKRPKIAPQKWLDEAKLAACIQATVCTDPAGVAVVYDTQRADFRMFDADAWEPPSTPGLMPWSPPEIPKSDVICVVKVCAEACAALRALAGPTKLNAQLDIIAEHDDDARRVLCERGLHVRSPQRERR